MLIKFKHNAWCWFREQGQCQDYWFVISWACLNNPFRAKCFINWHFLSDVLPCLILLFGCQCRWQSVEQFIIMPDDPITKAAIFTLGEVWAPNLTALGRPGLCFWTRFRPSFSRSIVGGICVSVVRRQSHWYACLATHVWNASTLTEDIS